VGEFEVSFGGVASVSDVPIRLDAPVAVGQKTALLLGGLQAASGVVRRRSR